MSVKRRTFWGWSPSGFPSWSSLSANCSVNNTAQSQWWVNLQRWKRVLNFPGIAFHLLWCRCALLLLVSPLKWAWKWCSVASVRADVLSKNPSLRVFHFLFLLIGGHVTELAEVSKRSVGEEVEAGEVWGSSGRGDKCLWWWFCVMCFPLFYTTPRRDRSPLSKGGDFSGFISKTPGWCFPCCRTRWLLLSRNRNRSVHFHHY